jgi:hypothetical protein
MEKMTTPNADNLRIGAAQVWFNRFDENGDPTSWLHLGNCDTFDFNTTVDTKEKKSSMAGNRAVLKSIVVGTETDLTLALTEYDLDILALFMLGEKSSFAQNVEASVVARAINGGVALEVDKWYDLNDSNGDPAVNVDVDTVQQAIALTLTAAANASGGNTAYTGTITGGGSNAHVGKKFTVTGFSTSANNIANALCVASTTTTLTLVNASGAAETHAGLATGTDIPTDSYETNVGAGLIRLLSTGPAHAAQAGVTTWSGSIPVMATSQLQGLTVGKIEGMLRLVDAEDLNTGKRLRVDFKKVSMTPDGNLPMIGEDFGTFNMKGKVEQDSTAAVGQQYFRLLELS